LNGESVTELLINEFVREASVTSTTGPKLPGGQTSFDAIYRFYREMIKSMVGLHGYALQLKVAKAL
jgi:hypothetical protein